MAAILAEATKLKIPMLWNGTFQVGALDKKPAWAIDIVLTLTVTTMLIYITQKGGTAAATATVCQDSILL